MLLAAAAALASFTAPNVTIEQIAWDVTEQDGDFFLPMLAMVDPADSAALAEGMHDQTLAHYGRSDLIAGHSSFHERRRCSVADSDAISLDALLEQAAATRILIINEAHAAPWHRDTTRALLAPLKALGYTHFAAETFANPQGDAPDPVATHPDEPFARRTDGTYFDPAFGRLVREAKALGFTLAAYEESGGYDPDLSPEERIARREAFQAAELAKLLADNPDARVVVHVGHAHVREEPILFPDGRKDEWMALRLARESGIDPLTIAQTYCTGPVGSAMRILPVPTDLRAEIGVDYGLEVAPPEDFRVRGDEAIAINIPPSWRAASGWTVVEAMHADEPDVAIPADSLAVHASETGNKFLYLESGRYRIRLRPVDNIPSDVRRAGH
ncbi:hypothetical protein [Sphingomicrobium flavum]|uniref:hypothetical protein n=1 Tax=Sphingomicrobium flavum TaxID=1229164 RepID=UPI0021AD6E19|nr:hypothetical protein [Sphingomicrobium flavum]